MECNGKETAWTRWNLSVAAIVTPKKSEELGLPSRFVKKMAWSASYAILILGALSVLTPLTTYAIAVIKGHVDPLFPQIGSTGDKPPESTLFTQLIVLTTASVLLVIHIRFVFVSSYCAINQVEPCYSKLNNISRYIGYVFCIGLLLLACFQQSNAYYVHTISSTILFTTGSFFYVMIQTVISYRLRRYTLGGKTVYARVFLNFLIFVFTSSYLIGFILSNWRCNSCRCAETRWDRDEHGFKCHLIASISEWILLGLYVSYIMSYYAEFRMVSLTTTKIYVTSHNGNASSEVGT